MAKSRGVRRGGAVLAAGAVVQVFCGIPAAWGVFRAPVAQGYGFGRGAGLLAFAVLVAAYGIGCAAGGLLQDKKGPRYAALCGTGLLGTAFLAASVIPPGNAPLFYLVYSAPAGVGSAFLGPAVLSCVQKWYAGKKGWATGVTGAAMGLSGAFFTGAVKGIGGLWGIRVCFAVLGAGVLLLCGAGAAVLQNPPMTKDGKPLPGLTLKQMLATRNYKLCVAAVALAAPPVLLFSPEILQLAAEHGLPESATPWCIILGSAASAAGRLALPALSDALGRKRVLLGVYLGLGGGMLAFAPAAGWWVVGTYAWLTFCYSGGAAVQPALNTDLFGLAHAGVNYGFLALGMSAGSLLSYFGSVTLPPGARYWLAGACAAAGFCCVAALDLQKPL